VLHQTYTDFELIIIDDCSTDASGEIAQKYAEQDPRVSYYRNDKNIKLPASLNKGFSLAKGKYLTWTSCDNEFKENALEAMVHELDSNRDLGLVYASMDIIDEQGTVTSTLDAGEPCDLIFRNVVGACFLYRATVAREVGEYDVSLFLCEDYEYWLRIAEVSKIKNIPDNLYLYRRHLKSLSAQRERDIIEKGIAVQRRYYSKFVKTREQAAIFYAHLRARDIYNPLRQFYLFIVLWYSPKIFCSEVCGLIKRRFVG
jgi:glycosyltransferase involved in cell wall biosynthesis